MLKTTMMLAVPSLPLGIHWNTANSFLPLPQDIIRVRYTGSLLLSARYQFFRRALTQLRNSVLQ